jgi:DNA-binding PadR family transcriptional regulator
VYSLTRSGRRSLADQRALWQRFKDAIGGLFGETSHATVRPDH